MEISSQLFRMLTRATIKTPVSMTLHNILLDPVLFDDPMIFRPERWLASNSELERICRNYIPFGRGGRICIGMKYNLSLLRLN